MGVKLTQVPSSSENRCQAGHGPRALQPRDCRAYLGPRDITLGSLGPEEDDPDDPENLKLKQLQ